MAFRSINPFPALTRASFRKRLWVGASALAVFLITLTIGNQFIDHDRSVSREMLGHDFLVFYTAGKFAREGKFEKMYDLWAVARAEFRTGAAAGLEMGPGFGPYWNPPFVAWAFAPLSVLPYGDALDAWRAISLIALLISIVLLTRMLPAESGWQIKMLIPVLLGVSMPFIQAVSHGQNTFISLMLLTIVVTLWRSRHAFLGGLVCGLLFYKPQLGAIVALVMVASLGRRALLGVAVTGTFLLLVTIATMPGALSEYAIKLGPNLQWMQEQNHYLWQRHITFKGFWRLLFQGSEMGPTRVPTIIFWAICTIAMGWALARVAWRNFRDAQPDRCSTDRLITATIVAMPLLMPFYFDYDLVLLVIPATLFAAEMLRSAAGAPIQKQDVWLTRAWVALYASTLLNTTIAGHVRLNITAFMLIWVAALTIQRALRDDQQVATTPDSLPLPLRSLGQAA